MKNKFTLLICIVFSIQLNAQSNDEKYYNADAPTYNTDNHNRGIKGYDPVAYFTVNKAVKGLNYITSEYEGVEYYFSSKENKILFDESPEKYLPKYGGYCAYGFGIERKGEYKPGKYPINPETFKIIDNQLYLFYNSNGYNALQYWNLNEELYKSKADMAWEEIEE